MNLGEIIEQYLRANNLSQREFARKCGDISNGYISMIVAGINPSTGKPPLPKLDKLKLIAEGMGMSLNQLLSVADDMPVDLSESIPDFEMPSRADLNRINEINKRPTVKNLVDKMLTMKDEDILLLFSIANKF